MKVLVPIFVLLAICLGQTPASPGAAQSAQSLPAGQENARKAKRLIDQMIQALGGQAYLNVQDSSQEGRSYSFHHGQSTSVGVLYWRFTKFPDKERVELTKKRDVVYLYNGNKGYEVTYKGTAFMEEKALSEYLRRREYSLDWVLRRWINEPGVALFYDGTKIAEQKPAEQVTIMNSRNEAVTIYIDPSTHLPIKRSFTWRDPVDKERDTDDEAYDNFRPVQGVMTPFSVTRYYNGDMAGQRFLNSISYNQALSDAMFDANAPYDPRKPLPK
jgi:hypothetical protein